jgi:beta-galactosidase
VSGVSVFDGVRHDGPVTVAAGAVTVIEETQETTPHP